ncbi:MAG: winged helix-turn-helix domain-containing protein [Dysgonomonas sp.]
MKEKIGTNAGAIWTYLNESGEKGLKEVKKVCKLTEKDMYAALGWLAREGKIELEEVKDDIKVRLL